MPAKFVIKQGTSGKYRFNLHAANGQVIATSESYETKRAGPPAALAESDAQPGAAGHTAANGHTSHHAPGVVGYASASSPAHRAVSDASNASRSSCVQSTDSTTGSASIWRRQYVLRREVAGRPNSRAAASA